MKKSKLRRFLKPVLLLALLGLLTVLIVNGVMLAAAAPSIIDADDAAGFDADCILVLGAGVRNDGSPSDMLRDRIDTGIALYEAGAAPKLLMSGDHGRKHYDEVNVMRSRALDAGIPSPDIFMDHAGFSTYDSLCRARDVFAVKRVVIVTQEYHLTRALCIAKSLGLEAVGVPADLNRYAGQSFRDLREAAARCKDLLYIVFKPAPVVLGEVIPISGNGEATLG